MTEGDYAAELKYYIRHLQQELKNGSIPAPEPIPGHAILRYLERIRVVDMRRFSAEILPHERRGLLAPCSGKIKSNGQELICSKGVVVSMVAQRPALRRFQGGIALGLAQSHYPVGAPRPDMPVSAGRDYISGSPTQPLP